MKTLLAIAALVATSFSLRADSAKVESLKKDFARVSALDVPARGASAVAAAPINSRRAAADDVVRAAIATDASVTPQLIAEIARSSPDLAASSAATATSLQPDQLSPITKAAVTVAPDRAGSIVTELAKAQPTSFATIGIASVEASPKSAEAVLSGIGKANPTLKKLIARVNTRQARTHYSAVDVLKRTESLLTKLAASSQTTPEAILAADLTPAMEAQLPELTASVLAAPASHRPYTPGLPSPGEITTSQARDNAPKREESKP